MANSIRRSSFALSFVSFVLATQVPLFCERHFWHEWTTNGPNGGYSCSYKSFYEAFFSPWAEPTASVIALNIALLLLYSVVIFCLFRLAIRFVQWLRSSKVGKRWFLRAFVFLVGLFSASWLPVFCLRSLSTTSTNGVVDVDSISYYCSQQNFYEALWSPWAMTNATTTLMNSGLLLVCGAVIGGILGLLYKFVLRLRR